jgi:rare lipoprotein A
MEIALRMERTADFTGWFRGLFTVAALVFLCPFARQTAIPAMAFPAMHVATPPALPALSAQPVVPVEVLAPVANAKVTTLTRVKSGLASWYGSVLQNHLTASGRRFNMYEMTAAHRSLPFGSKVKVTNMRNHRSVVVTITDRGVLNPDRVIDLSYGAAQQLKMVKSGVDQVRLEVLTSKNVPLVTGKGF